MKLRSFAIAPAVVAMITGTANAAGFMYRSTTTSRWVGIMAKGDTRTSGTFAGSLFADPAPFGRAPVASDACGGGVRVAVFSAKMQILAPAPNTGIFIYDANTDTIFDVVVQGGLAPGGTWAAFDTVNPAVAIDSGSCTAYVFFWGKITGAPLASNTGVFMVPVALPAFAVGAVGVVALEGTTLAPAPFAGAVFNDFISKTMHLAAVPVSGLGGVAVAFPAKVLGGGTTPSNDTAIFLDYTSGAMLTAAREGDSSCPPMFSGATLYGDFPSTLQVAVGDLAPLFPPGSIFVSYRAKAQGVAIGADTAVEASVPTLGCGGSIALAVEGAATAFGGSYADFAAGTPLGGSAESTGGFFPASFGFMAKATGGVYSKAVIQAIPFPTSVTAIAKAGAADSALSDSAISLPPDPGPSTNGGSAIVYGAGVKGFPSAIFESSVVVGPTPPEALTFSGKYPQIDAAGNVSARYP
jgi:hypothetical protein